MGVSAASANVVRKYLAAQQRLRFRPALFAIAAALLCCALWRPLGAAHGAQPDASLAADASTGTQLDGQAAAQPNAGGVFGPPPLDTRADAAAAAVAPVIAPPQADEPGIDGLVVADIVLEQADASLGAAPAWVPQAIKRGDVYQSSLGRQLLREIVAGGNFANAELRARRVGAEVALIVTAAPRRLISDISIVQGDLPFTREEVLREAELQLDGELLGGSAGAAESRLQTLCSKRGFKNAKVTVQVGNGRDALHKSLTIVMIPGKPQRILSRIFESVDATPEMRELYASYTQSSGAQVDEDALTTADSELQQRVRARGFHDAIVNHVTTARADGANLRVRVVLGDKYSIRFTGANHYDDATLISMLNLDTESDRSASHLSDKIRAFYIARGFLDCEIASEESQTAARKTITFKILERAQVGVLARRFPCFQAATLSKQPHESAPISEEAIGNEIESFLEEELPGGGFIRNPHPQSVDATLRGLDAPVGNRASPVELNANWVFAPLVYDKAIAHLQELYRADGYLSASVGPLVLMRRECKRGSPPGECLPIPSAVEPDRCTYDASGLPTPDAGLRMLRACTMTDGSNRMCENDIRISIPIRLGPRTILRDVAFAGITVAPASQVLEELAIPVGTAASSAKLEEARRRLVAFYLERGYVFSRVSYKLEPSQDHTRARAKFEVAEGEPVVVSGITIKGNRTTLESVIRERIALKIGSRFTTSAVSATRERLALLGVFSSIDVALDEPFLPNARKQIVVTVSEQSPWNSELRAGLSTGEGIRLRAEIGNRNLFGRAISLSLSGQASYLPTAFIKLFVQDETVRRNFSEVLGEPGFDTRIAARVNASLQFPTVGLGPDVRGVIDGAFVHDLQRDYYVRKLSFAPTLAYVPSKKILITLGPSIEYSDARIFAGSNIEEFLRSAQADPRQVSALLVPDGANIAFAQKLTFTWDRRDNRLDPTRGTFYFLSVEHVDAYPQGESDSGATRKQSHFIRVAQTISGYLPLYRSLRLALQLRVGANFQLTDSSSTYPDRLFFLGGTESMRAWFPNSYIPQDDIDRIRNDSGKPDSDPSKFTARSRPVRGGNLMVNPRVELRIPITGPFETVVFGDFANLWGDLAYPFRAGGGLPPIRMSLGTGVRFKTVFPIAVDLGWNPTRSYYDDLRYAVNFSIGLY